jgi:hypothetical protein
METTLGASTKALNASADVLSPERNDDSNIIKGNLELAASQPALTVQAQSPLNGKLIVDEFLSLLNRSHQAFSALR